MMTTPKRREEEHVFRIGAVAGIVGSLLAMVGNLLHPAPPIGDPEGVAQTITQSEIWVPVHLVIVVGTEFSEVGRLRQVAHQLSPKFESFVVLKSRT